MDNLGELFLHSPNIQVMQRHALHGKCQLEKLLPVRAVMHS